MNHWQPTFQRPPPALESGPEQPGPFRFRSVIASAAMAQPNYFVTVFGNPDIDAGRDLVESGVYTAAKNYPRFPVQLGDVMLLYCTEDYAAYSQKFAGIGIVLEVIRESPESIRFRWIPFSQPIPRSNIDQAFEPSDRQKMEGKNLKNTTGRVFGISRRSFDGLVGVRLIAWDRL